jgi:hypothetical protein
MHDRNLFRGTIVLERIFDISVRMRVILSSEMLIVRLGKSNTNPMKVTIWDDEVRFDIFSGSPRF